MVMEYLLMSLRLQVLETLNTVLGVLLLIMITMVMLIYILPTMVQMFCIETMVMEHLLMSHSSLMLVRAVGVLVVLFSTTIMIVT